MTQTAYKQPKSPSWLPTRNQHLKRYSAVPGLLALEIDKIFGIIKTDDEKAVHNRAVEDLQRIYPNRDGMLIAMAKAIIKSAGQEAVE